jgi:hypothetical protein
MKIISPLVVGGDNQLSTTLVIEALDWEAGTYDADDKAVYETYVYEATTSTTDRPDTGAAKSVPTWARLGRANAWRLYYDGTDSRSVSPVSENLEVEIEIAEVITEVGLLGLRGSEVQVTMTDDAEGVVYDQTKTITDIGVDDWWGYYFSPYAAFETLIFTGLPSYLGVTLKIKVTPNGTGSSAECGRLAIGSSFVPGVTLEDVQVRIDDFGRKTRDAFGNLELKPRRPIFLIDYEIICEANMVETTKNQFRDLASVGALFIGDDDLPETVAFGVFESFSIISKGYENALSRSVFTVEEF